MSVDSSETWRDKWLLSNQQYIQEASIEDGIVKMLHDARRDGIARLEFPVTGGKQVRAAVQRCSPWTAWQSWGPYHLFVNIREQSPLSASRNEHPDPIDASAVLRTEPACAHGDSNQSDHADEKQQQQQQQQQCNTKPHAVVPSTEQGACVICYESGKNMSAVIPCGHVFCHACIQPLQVCPMCRGSITSLLSVFLPV